MIYGLLIRIEWNASLYLASFSSFRIEKGTEVDSDCEKKRQTKKLFRLHNEFNIWIKTIDFFSLLFVIKFRKFGSRDKFLAPNTNASTKEKKTQRQKRSALVFKRYSDSGSSFSSRGGGCLFNVIKFGTQEKKIVLFFR